METSFVDRPFAPALETVVDLPFPPSVNRIWRAHKAGKMRVSLSDEYKQWKKQADFLALALGQVRGWRKLPGHFTAEIIVSESHRRHNTDLDNRVKAILDWAQSRELIQNDSLLDHLIVFWGYAPHGARLILRSVTP